MDSHIMCVMSWQAQGGYIQQLRIDRSGFFGLNASNASYKPLAILLEKGPVGRGIRSSREFTLASMLRIPCPKFDGN